MPLDDATRRQFEGWGKALPTTDSHGTEDDILANMTRLLPNEWRMEGNKLIGETSMGPLVQFVPTDQILMGTDSAGLPIFKKVDFK